VRTALQTMIARDPLASNRLMAAQALGLCGDAAAAFQAIDREVRATADGYVLFHGVNAFQYSHTDDRLTREDWLRLAGREIPKGAPGDPTGFEYTQRIVRDALALWPERRRVD
jgi:N-sulfoglucosamine sulfohydrolase